MYVLVNHINIIIPTVFIKQILCPQKPPKPAHIHTHKQTSSLSLQSLQILIISSPPAILESEKMSLCVVSLAGHSGNPELQRDHGWFVPGAE